MNLFRRFGRTLWTKDRPITKLSEFLSMYKLFSLSDKRSRDDKNERIISSIRNYIKKNQTESALRPTQISLRTCRCVNRQTAKFTRDLNILVPLKNIIFLLLQYPLFCMQEEERINKWSSYT
jgi:hypothetical protein